MRQPVTGGWLWASDDDEMTARAVVAYLRAEGRTVEGFQRPQLGPGRSPDFILKLDGSPTALEVVSFLEATASKAEARMRKVEAALKVRLQASMRRTGCKLVLRITFEVLPHQSHRRPVIENDADRLASRIKALVEVWPNGLETGIGFETGVGWIKSAELFAWPAAEPSFHLEGTPAPVSGGTDTAALLARTIATRGAWYLQQATTAILAVRSEFDNVEGLHRAVAETDEPIPFWRIYNVWSGGNAGLVYESHATR